MILLYPPRCIDFPVTSQWFIYDGDTSERHVVTAHQQEQIGLMVVTEADGQRFVWLPTVLAWLADPAP